MANPALPYNENVGDEICELIILGRSLRSICEQEDMPSLSTVLKWLRTSEAFALHYARAREEQIETYTDQINDIADNPTGDVQRDKLRIDTRKWIASKLKPKKYGDKLDVEHSGEVAVSFVTVYEKKPVDGEDV